MSKKTETDNSMKTSTELWNEVWPKRGNIDLESAKFYLQEAKEQFKDCNANVDHWDNRRFQMIVAYTGYTSFSVFKVAEHFIEGFDSDITLFTSMFTLGCGLALATMSLTTERHFHFSGAIPEATMSEHRLSISLKEQIIEETLGYQARMRDNLEVGGSFRKDFLGLLILFIISISAMGIYLAFRSKIPSP